MSRPAALIAMGTRPEVIKLAPLVQRLAERRRLRPLVCVSAQHRDLLDSALRVFRIRPDYDLDLMRHQQTIESLVAMVFAALPSVLRDARPRVVVVQGDTSTAMAAALTAFHMRIPCVHVEAGLRTGDLNNPFPEEANRRLISVVARMNYAPTRQARDNLLAEGVEKTRIRVTGNTVVDALHWALSSQRFGRKMRCGSWETAPRRLLLTLHRRESHGAVLSAIAETVVAFAARHGFRVFCPLHPSPAVRRSLRGPLSAPNVCPMAPLDYLTFISYLSEADLVVTDSGGVQEEAACLGRPFVVAREHTERREAIEAGIGILGGTSPSRLNRALRGALDIVPKAGPRLARRVFGDGRAAERICESLERIWTV